MEERLVVFNADDLGVSAGTNTGIRAAHEAGLVREASMCVTGIAAEEGAAIAREADLGVGLHLSFTLGKALTGRLRGLTDENGQFQPLQQVLRSCALGRPNPEEVAREVRAQLRRLRELGVTASHLNGHHHVHVFPTVWKPVQEVVREERIPYVRMPSESARTGRFLSPRRWVTSWFTRAARRGKSSVAWPPSLPFVGLDVFDRDDYRTRFLATARRLRAPATEWMVHPREDDADFARLDHHPPGGFANSQSELHALTNPEVVAEIRALGIRPARYSELGEAQAG